MKKLVLLSILTLGFFSGSHAPQYGWNDINGNIPDYPYDTVYNNYGFTIVALPHVAWILAFRDRISAIYICKVCGRLKSGLHQR